MNASEERGVGTLLLLGGGSDIGLAIARRFAASGHAIQLAARDVSALAPVAQDLEVRFEVAVSRHRFDALDTEGFERFVDSLRPLPDVVVCAVGLLGDQSTDQRSVEASSRVLRSNFEGPALVLGALADRFEARGSGTLVGISSVAGERGRASNYVYGSAKAGFTAFLSGLRNRLAGSGVHVLTVLPGFVATRMVEGLELPERLTTSPEKVAEAVERAVRRGRDVIHVAPIWRAIMLVIRALPEPVFKRTKL